MIFTELRFVAIFLVTAAAFFLAPRHRRPMVLALGGLLFYAIYANAFLAVALVLVLLVYLGNARIAWLAGTLTVALLIWFKLPPLPGLGTTTAVLVPLGFSYMAFELLHLLIERRRGKIGRIAPWDLLAFVFFMPARIAGPIKRFPAFTAAVQEAELTMANVYFGFVRILMGLAKKFLLADLLALTVAESRSVTSTRHAWMVILAYSLQIFLDFSAYSDIAIGFARMIGIRLPENFRSPYLAPNIREFWDRWHITLSHWVRDYVFSPLGRKLFRTRLRPWPAAIASISYLVTFLIVGAWHGLTYAFLLWGLYHGVLLALYHVVQLRTPAAIIDHPLYVSRFARTAGIASTFLLVTIGWVPFLLPMPKALTMWGLMFGVSP